MKVLCHQLLYRIAISIEQFQYLLSYWVLINRCSKCWIGQYPDHQEYLFSLVSIVLKVRIATSIWAMAWSSSKWLIRPKINSILQTKIVSTIILRSTHSKSSSPSSEYVSLSIQDWHFHEFRRRLGPTNDKKNVQSFHFQVF